MDEVTEGDVEVVLHQNHGSNSQNIQGNSHERVGTGSQIYSHEEEREVWAELEVPQEEMRVPCWYTKGGVYEAT